MHSKAGDLKVNICRAKQLTNMRAAGKDIKTPLDEPRTMGLDDALEYINDDELVEVGGFSVGFPHGFEWGVGAPVRPRMHSGCSAHCTQLLLPLPLPQHPGGASRRGATPHLDAPTECLGNGNGVS